jgi:hypothetical protein
MCLIAVADFRLESTLPHWSRSFAPHPCGWLVENAGAGDNLCPGKLLPIIGWTEVAFEFLQGVSK